MSMAPTYLRFFARLRRDGWDLECPACGRVYSIRGALRASAAATRQNRKDAQVFDEMTGIFQCQNRRCRRAYQLGINAYPLGRGVIIPERRRVPVDTVADLEQARVLKSLEAHRGLIVREGIGSRLVLGRQREGAPRGAAGPVNTTAGCSCPRTIRGDASVKFRDDGCPRHGTKGEGDGDDA